MIEPIANSRHSVQSHRYAIVLAGGQGTRLAPITERIYGYPRAKQFCRFGSERTLLEEALLRAEQFTGAASRIVVSAAACHRAELAECLVDWPGVARAEQPRNRDTTPGILLPLLHIVATDPLATVLVLPSDHAVSDDDAFVHAFVSSLAGLAHHPEKVLLGGASLREPEPDLGWIVPGSSAGHWRRVAAFEEKPTSARTTELHCSGALANTFAFVGRGVAIARLARRYAPAWWTGLAHNFLDPTGLQALYSSMPPSSFSRDVLSRAADSLGVVALEGVEWSDVGTPERLVAVRGHAMTSLVA